MKTDVDAIFFCGVHFMFETAKMLNPNKQAILPDMDAGCSLADSAYPNKFKTWVDSHSDHVGSTTSIVKFTYESIHEKFIIVTEPRVIHQMEKEKSN